MSAGAATGFDPALSRRSFLQTMGGLVVAFNLFGRTAPALGAEQSPASPAAGNLDAWLAVHPDNTATLFTGKVETGTGVQTALAQFAAEEADFPFERLDVVMGTTSLTVDQGPTYGSMTIRYAGPQIRHAAAAGRQALLELASRHFGVRSRLARRAPRARSPVARLSLSAPSPTESSVDGKRINVEIGGSGEGFA